MEYSNKKKIKIITLIIEKLDTVRNHYICKLFDDLTEDDDMETTFPELHNLIMVEGQKLHTDFFTNEGPPENKKRLTFVWGNAWALNGPGKLEHQLLKLNELRETLC